jgi:hypothetical protein
VNRVAIARLAQITVVKGTPRGNGSRPAADIP